MTELQLALGAESTIDVDGVSYRLGGITLEVMSMWEGWLCDETMSKMLLVLGKHRDGEEKAINAVAKLSASGVFDYFSEESQERLRTMKGQNKLVYFRIKQHQQTVDEKTIADFVEKGWAELYRAVLAELVSMEKLLPNVPAPTTGASQSESAGEASLPK